jgi:hypothetical protein
MKTSRIYADEGGESHFSVGEIRTMPVQMFPGIPPFSVNRFACANVKLIATPTELSVHDWHTAPKRQLAVSLNGAVEYETSDGEVRRFGPGEVVLVEDTRGKGHITRFDDGAQFFLHLPVPDDWTIS